MKYFNLLGIQSIKPKAASRGFLYGYLENVFYDGVYEELISSFPPVETFQFTDKPDSGGGHKRFYVGPVYYSGKDWGCYCHFSHLPEVWKAVLREVASSEFIKILAQATRIKFNSLCNFGFTYGNEGCQQEPHIDGAARPNDLSPVHATIALLLYFNKKPGGSSGTCIYEIDRKTKIFQVPNLRNTLSFFQQHPDSWHGFPIVSQGEDRRLISLSYSLEKNPINLKDSSFHKIYCPVIKRVRKVRQYLV